MGFICSHSRAQLTRNRANSVNDSAQLAADSLLNAVIKDSELGQVRLRDGSLWQERIDSTDQQPAEISMGRCFTYLDLDKDGFQDAVAFISSNYGGTGIFHSMDFFLNRNGSALHVSSISLGDRTAVDSLTVVSDTIRVFLTIIGPNDLRCCPNTHIARRFLYQDNAVKEIK